MIQKYEQKIVHLIFEGGDFYLKLTLRFVRPGRFCGLIGARGGADRAG